MGKIILLLFLCGNLFAGGISGNVLLKGMKEYKRETAGNKDANHYESIFFQSYAIGVMDGLHGNKICPPKNTNLGQLLAMSVKYIVNNPEQWHKSAFFLISEPLIKTFPCIDLANVVWEKPIKGK